MIAFIIVRFIYYPQQRDKEYVFTFVTFNSVIFLVMGLLSNTDLSVGVGFGLFAIFSILRYRTDTIKIREMTYLFVLIALAVVNALLIQSAAYVEFLMVNVAVVVILYILEKGWGFAYDVRKTITYDRIDLIRLERWSEMMADLEERTGLPIKHVEIGSLNFLRDSARITIYCDANAIKNSQVRFVPGNGYADDFSD